MFAFDRKFLPTALASVLMFIGVVGFGVRDVLRVRASAERAQQAYAQRSRVHDVRVALLEAEAARQRNVRDPDPAYVARYVAALAQLDHLLVAPSPPEFEQLRVLLKEQRARDRDSMDWSAGEVKPLDRMRQLLLRADERSDVEIARIERQRAAGEGGGIRLASLLTLLTAAAMAFAFWLLRRELLLRQRTAALEAGQRATLERSVEQRTQQLQQAVQELHLGEARLRSVFESASDAILCTDESLHVVLANPAAAAMFRCDLQRLIGAPIDRFIPERLRAHHRQEMLRFGRADNRARRMGRWPEVTGLRSDGEEFPIDAAISHVSVEGRQLYTVVMRDVTERRRAENALRSSEGRFRRLVAVLPEALFVNDGQKVIYANEAAQRLTGRGEAELVGRVPLEIFDAESQRLVQSRIEAMTSGQRVAAAAHETIVRPDGSTRRVISTAAQIEDEGGHAFIVLLRDVTELEQMQQELAASHAELQRLVEAQESIREEERRRIARELHDDLQQTLAAITLDLAAIAARLRVDRAGIGPLVAGVEALAAAALTSTRRIVNDLRPHVLDDLGLSAALEALATQFEQRSGVACSYEAGADIEDTALPNAVATCLYRVAQEALNNIGKHAAAGSARIALEHNGAAAVELRVEDDGSGIQQRDLHKPDSFGLLGMRERLRALGGTLHVGRGESGGTVVKVSLPLGERD